MVHEADALAMIVCARVEADGIHLGRAGALGLSDFIAESAIAGA